MARLLLLLLGGGHGFCTYKRKSLDLHCHCLHAFIVPAQFIEACAVSVTNMPSVVKPNGDTCSHRGEESATTAHSDKANEAGVFVCLSMCACSQSKAQFIRKDSRSR